MTLSATPPRRWRALLALAVVLAALLAGTWWAYHPGLSGSFQFDDFVNLPVLGATGPVDNWATFWRYITSGDADPTGRPIALLSFLIDARNWPANPRPFLRTNVILHLINGVLLFWVLRRLGLLLTGLSQPTATPTGPDGHNQRLTIRVHLAALLGTGLWLLHPLLVSTTLYIVQREAMLPATFTLLGLLAWLRGRRQLLDGHTASGLVWMVSGLGVCTTLGMLSKANGILLPALVLVIEWTILRKADLPPPIAGDHAGNASRQRHLYRWVMLVLAGLPTAFVTWYLVRAGYDGVVHGVSATRPWTEGQRLLTEPRVLMDYLQLLWLPRPFTPGLFNDQIRASASLLAPWTTLPCLLAVLGLITGACLLRTRLPAVALAILFYFVGQALESSSIALELYFEHRNYLPAMMMFWPLALWLCGVPQAIATHHSASTLTRDNWRWLKLGLAIMAIVGLATMTRARTSVWGDVHEQALLWAKLNPESPRAQANAAMAEMHFGHPVHAAEQLQGLLKQKPAQIQLAFNLFAAQCQSGNVPASTLQAVKTALSTTRNPGALIEHWFDRAISRTTHPPCPQLTLNTLVNLIHAGQSNPRLMAINGRRQDMDFILGRIALVRHQPDQALADFNRALDQDVRTTAALEQAALLGSAGYPRRGLAHLKHYQQTVARRHKARPRFGMPRIHAWVLKREHYWQRALVHLRRTLQADVKSKLGLKGAWAKRGVKGKAKNAAKRGRLQL